MDLKNVEAADCIVVPGVTMVIGTAPHFSVGLEPGGRHFGQYYTGAPGLLFARETVTEHDKLRFFHKGYLSDISPEELPRRAHVLERDAAGAYRPRLYAAWERQPGRYQLVALKGAPPRRPAPSPAGSSGRWSAISTSSNSSSTATSTTSITKYGVSEIG